MSRFRLIVFLLCGGLLMTMGAGCSSNAKKERHLAAAETYFQAGQYEEAEIEFKNVLQIEGLNPQAIARLGTIYFEQGRLGPAFQYLAKASELIPGDLELRRKVGMFHLATGKVDEARQTAYYLLDQNPPHPEAPILLAEATRNATDIAEARARLQKIPVQTAPVLTALAILDLREQKASEAERLLKRALELDPKFSSASATLALLYWSRKDLAQAEKFFIAAVESSPARSPRRIQLAQFYLQTNQRPAARRTLEEAIKNTPDFVTPRLILSSIALQEKNYDESLLHLEQALARDATHPDALLLAAEANLGKGDHQKAISTLETAAKLYPGAPRVHHQLGVAYLAGGDTGKATGSFAQATTLAPDFAPSVTALAELQVKQGNFVPAIVALKQLLEKTPNNANAAFLLANAYRLQGNLEDALALYQRIATALPRHPQVHFFTGTILLQQNKKAEARAAFAKAAEFAPNDIAVLEQLVALDLGEKDYSAALKRLNDQVSRTPTDARLQLLLARTFLVQSDHGAAEAALKKAVELRPDYMEAYLALAQLHVSRNEPQKALAELTTAATKSPNDVRPVMLAAQLHERQKNHPAARGSYERVLAIDPKNGTALNNLAIIYTNELGDLDKGLEVAQKARDLLPNVPEVADTLGWVLYKKRNFPRALALIDEAETRLPDNPELQFHLGMVTYAMGNAVRAKTAFTRALQLSKTFTGADAAAQHLAVLAINPATADATARKQLEQIVSERNDDSIALGLLGAIHEREGDMEKALKAYESAFALAPGNVDAGLGAIRAYRARQDTKKAIEVATAMREALPADPRVAHALGKLSYETGDYSRALGLLQESERRGLQDSETLYDLANASYSMGRVDDARMALETALQKDPDFSRSSEARAFLEMISLSSDGAKASSETTQIEAALRNDPDNVPALVAKGLALEQQRDYASAIQAYEKALKRFPNFSPAQKRLAIIYAQETGNDEKAFDHASSARRAFPTDPDVAKALGIILFRQENLPRAVTLLQESSRSRSEDAELFYYLGMAQQGVKDTAASRRSLQRAIELGLSGDRASEAKRVLAEEKTP